VAHNADSAARTEADAIGGSADMVAFELIRRS
jgi:hypothetical protein